MPKRKKDIFKVESTGSLDPYMSDDMKAELNEFQERLELQPFEERKKMTL